MSFKLAYIIVNIAEFLLWGGIVIIFYTYIGYGIVLLFLSKLKPDVEVNLQGTLPSISIIIAAYNEEDFIAEKIENTLMLEYPQGKVQIIVVTDGSSDNTVNIVKGFVGIDHYHLPERRGKIHAVNRVIKYVTTPVLIFTDANTKLNSDALMKIARHYSNPTIGGVAGEKRIYSDAPSESVAGEGLYWKYESALKKLDSKLGSVVGAAGELFSVRTALYQAPSKDMIIEDFYLSLVIASRGFKFAYEPNAYAIESSSASLAEEWKRKVRICAGAFQAMGKLRQLLNPFKFGFLSFQYISHRVLRWTLAPISLLTVLLSNTFLLSAHSIYLYFWVLQIAFYFVALLGMFFKDKRIAIKGFFVPLYFVMMNAAVYVGFYRFIKRQQSVVWEKAIRRQYS